MSSVQANQTNQTNSTNLQSSKYTNDLSIRADNLTLIKSISTGLQYSYSNTLIIPSTGSKTKNTSNLAPFFRFFPTFK